jgi:hypothetical protein
MAGQGAQLQQVQQLEVEVQGDHLERLARCKPSSALTELIWNALDADATNVSVEFRRNGLDGIEGVTVSDNGHGIGGEGHEANDLFRRLGGSWKKTTTRTKQGRVVHGKAGEGRFRAFALGGIVTWKTRTLHDGAVFGFSITRTSGSRRFDRSEPVPVKEKPGTDVVIENVPATPAPDTESVFTALCQEFALYLRQYPGTKVLFDHRPIDPTTLIAKVDDAPLRVEIAADETIEGVLTIVEWAAPVERALFLCDEDGFALAEVPAGIQAPGFNFTAHVKARYLRGLKEQNLIDSELVPGRERVIAAVKRALKDHFRARSAELASGAVERWRSEDIYPYASTPSSPVEQVERQVFDIVALNLSGHLPDFDKTDTKQKRLTFRLLKQAVEENPESLRTILGEVLGLPKEQQDDLADLLRETSLSAIINAAKVVGDRIKFLAGLDGLLFEPESKKRLLERRQLHRILAPNTWIFGEEFNLTVDDESLNAVLVKHLELLGRDPNEVPSTPVLREDGRTGLVDLMLSRLVPQPGAVKREHLVVELKRPSQKIDDGVLGQIKEYAFAVAADERFRDTDTRWRFIAVSNEISTGVRRQASQRNREFGLIHDDESQSITVWVFTWGQLLERARGRLEFFRKELNYNANQDSAQTHLKKLYSKYLPDLNEGTP